jgi:hypothetical protein
MVSIGVGGLQACLCCHGLHSFLFDVAVAARVIGENFKLSDVAKTNGGVDEGFDVDIRDSGN